jgi:hypothetical protein
MLITVPVISSSLNTSYETPRHTVLPVFLLGPNNPFRRLFSHTLTLVDLSQGGKFVENTVNPQFSSVYNMDLAGQNSPAI